LLEIFVVPKYLQWLEKSPIVKKRVLIFEIASKTQAIAMNEKKSRDLFRNIIGTFIGYRKV